MSLPNVQTKGKVGKQRYMMQRLIPGFKIMTFTAVQLGADWLKAAKSELLFSIFPFGFLVNGAINFFSQKTISGTNNNTQYWFSSYSTWRHLRHIQLTKNDETLCIIELIRLMAKFSIIFTESFHGAFVTVRVFIFERSILQA